MNTYGELNLELRQCLDKLCCNCYEPILGLLPALKQQSVVVRRDIGNN